MTSSTCIVIPVYKQFLSFFEKNSLYQVTKILGNLYDIFLVCPDNLNISEYTKISESLLIIKKFNKKYFVSTTSYSELCKSKLFYESFSNYTYMLIYQLDSWIFENNIEYFVNLGYDYIGAPHLFDKSYGPTVGNGGFSLRRISKFIELCSNESIINKQSEYKDEDLFFTETLKDYLNIAPLSEAVKFSAQNHSDWVIQHNNNKLPMGCHNPKRFITDVWKNNIPCLNSSLQKQKLAVYVICNDKFVKGAKVALYSFLKNNLWFTGDIVVCYNDKLSSLSDESKNDISLVYNKIIFKHVDLSIYEKLLGNLRKHIPSKFLPAVLKFEIFDKNYDKVLYLDSDVLVIDSLYQLFLYDYDVCACSHDNVTNNHAITENDRINAGIIFLNKNALSDKVKNELICEGESFSISSKWFSRCGEQDIINSYLHRPGAVHTEIIESKYNRLKRVFKYNNLSISNECIIHYIESKPWNNKNYSEYSYIYDIWTNWYNSMNSHLSHNKYVIYTAITGKYDNLIIPKCDISNFDFVCFVDNKDDYKNVHCWKIVEVPNTLKSLTKVKQQRYIKTHPHEFFSDYTCSIWIDANIEILKNPSELLNNLSASVEIPRHPKRRCIYDEGKECIKLKKDIAENVNPQLEHYKNEGYPKNAGLVQSNIVIRKHNSKDCITLMEAWWNEIEKYSHRDQLSFNYALWKNPKIHFTYLSKTLCNSEYFHWNIKHAKSKNKESTNKSNDIIEVKKDSTTIKIINKPTVIKTLETYKLPIKSIAKRY